MLRSLKQKQSLAFREQEKARFAGNTSDMNRYSAESAAYTKRNAKKWKPGYNPLILN